MTLPKIPPLRNALGFLAVQTTTLPPLPCRPVINLFKFRAEVWKHEININRNNISLCVSHFIHSPLIKATKTERYPSLFTTPQFTYYM